MEKIIWYEVDKTFLYPWKKFKKNRVNQFFLNRVWKFWKKSHYHHKKPVYIDIYVGVRKNFYRSSKKNPKLLHTHVIGVASNLLSDL